MFLIFDTETTGLPKNWKAPLSDSDNWPRMVQLAWQLHGVKGDLLEVKNYIIRPEGYTIPFAAEKVHGISTEKAMKEGEDLKWVLEEFNRTLAKTKFLVGHNVEFDISIVGAEYLRKELSTPFLEISRIDTKEDSTEFCALSGGKGGKFKWPNLSELHEKLFGASFEEAHNAAADVMATARCFLELLRLGVIDPANYGLPADFTAAFREANPEIIQPVDIQIDSHWEKKEATGLSEEADFISEESENLIPFTHLHVHTQYSILDGAADISGLLDKAKADGMVAMAITDHGNMFGVKEFHNKAKKKGIKPIIGCEVYVALRSCHDKEEIGRRRQASYPPGEEFHRI